MLVAPLAAEPIVIRWTWACAATPNRNTDTKSKDVARMPFAEQVECHNFFDPGVFQHPGGGLS
jgi:hypothetical protein